MLHINPDAAKFEDSCQAKMVLKMAAMLVDWCNRKYYILFGIAQ